MSCKILFLLSSLFYLTAGITRVCYYGAWSAKKNLRPELIDTSLCTHLMFAFVNLDDSYTNIVPENTFEGTQIMPFTSLKRTNPSVKILLSVGGWTVGSLPFTNLVANEARMRTFAANAVKYLRAHNFDGLDVDWEYPSKGEDKVKFIKLLEILHTSFVNEPNLGNKERLMLTAPVAPTEGQTLQAYEVAGLVKYLDWLGLMTYDFHGEWEETVNVHNALYSANDESVDSSVQYWLSQGVPKDKLLVGIPLYGRKFLLKDPTNNTIGALSSGGEFMPYYEICKMISSHTVTPVSLQTERVPYFFYQSQWITYEDTKSITEKATYIQTQGLAGAMLWAIDLDDYSGVCGFGTFPLARALKKGLLQEVVIG